MSLATHSGAHQQPSGTKGHCAVCRATLLDVDREPQFTYSLLLYARPETVCVDSFRCALVVLERELAVLERVA